MSDKGQAKRRLATATLIGAFEACMFLVGGAVSSTYGPGLGLMLIFVTNALAYFNYGSGG